jgi:hypothetical protein
MLETIRFLRLTGALNGLPSSDDFCGLAARYFSQIRLFAHCARFSAFI